MKKCEKCQIKVEENANCCPLCGGKLTVSGENGEFIFNDTPKTEEREPGGFEGILNISFDEKLKGMFMQSGLRIALAFMLIYIVYLVLVCATRPIMLLSGIVPAAVTFCILYPLLKLKKGKFKEAAHSSATVLYAISIAYMCIFILLFVGIAVCGAVLAFGGGIPWEMAFIYSTFGAASFEIGIALIVSTLFSALIMMPYFISMINIAKSLKSGLDGKVQIGVSGAGVFRVYTFIGTVLSVLVSASAIVAGDFSVIFALLWNAAQIIIANALCDFDRILKL